MSAKHMIVALGAVFGATEAANAAPIQIDFTGIVTDNLSLTDDVLSEAFAVGTPVSGRYFLDDGMDVVTYPSGFHAGDRDAPPNRITSSITAGDTTFRPSIIPDFPVPVAQQWNYDAVDYTSNYIAGEWWSNASIVDGYAKINWESDYVVTAISYMNLERADWGFTGIKTPQQLFNEIDFMTSFIFEENIEIYDMGSGPEYLRHSFVGGRITSLSVTHLNEPPVNVAEPGTLALLGAGMLGLLCYRRKLAGANPRITRSAPDTLLTRAAG